MARCARRSRRMAQCCRLGAAKRRASAGPGAKVLARSMAIANRASWQIGGRPGTVAHRPETAAQYAAKYDAYLTTVRAAAPTKTDPLYHSDSESRRPENRWQSKWRETRFLSRPHCQCRTPAATIRFESLLPRWPHVDR